MNLAKKPETNLLKPSLKILKPILETRRCIKEMQARKNGLCKIKLLACQNFN
jgi:hypothetical protein